MSSEQTMVERVAQACWQTQTIRPWEDAHEDEREEMIGYARAAIEAMRDPTDTMLTAVDCGGEKREWLSGKMRVSNWQGMIDAALNEHANAR